MCAEGFLIMVIVAMSVMVVNRGFQTRTVYLDYITCLRYTILVWNPGNKTIVFFAFVCCWFVLFSSPSEQWKNLCTCL